MDREAVLATIKEAYAARVRDDTETLSKFWAADATFEIAGDKTLLATFPGAGPGASQPTVEAIMAKIAMPQVEMIDAVVEYPRAAVMWRATVSFGGGEPFETVLYDFFTFDEAGKIRSMVQFADTARIVGEAQLAGW